MQKWVKNGWTPANTEYPASIALFTSGKAAMHINGVWEVPTMVDLAKKGQLFDWGAIQIPVLLRPAGDLGGFALVRHPEPQGQPGRSGQAQARARRRPLVQRALARMGGRRPCPGVPAGPGQRRVQGAQAEFGLCRRSPRPRSSIRSRCWLASLRPSTTPSGNYVIPAMNGEIDSGRRGQENAG